MRETEVVLEWVEVWLDDKLFGTFSSISDWNEFAGDELGQISVWDELADAGYMYKAYSAPSVPFEG